MMKQPNYYFLILLIIGVLGYSQETKIDSIVSNEKKTIQDDSQFRYHYYPNLQIYYDTQDDIYICKENNQWVKKNTMPSKSRGYSMSNTIFVLIKGYNGDTPYLYNEQHKKDFPPNFKSKKQTRIIVREKTN